MYVVAFAPAVARSLNDPQPVIGDFLRRSIWNPASPVDVSFQVSTTFFGLVLSTVAVRLAGAFSVGAGLTVTVKLQVAVLPDVSLAVQVTVVVPMGKVDPEVGLQDDVTPGQLSDVVGAG